MRQGEQLWRWSNLRGYATRGGPRSWPEGIGAQAENVQLVAGSLGKRRASTAAVSLTSGPAAPINYLSVHAYVTSGAIAKQLWAFTSTPTAHSWDGSSWTSQSLIDTAAAGTNVQAVTLNNKHFIAYDSASNRLHCYDGTSIRRVGILKPAAAPTTTDTGAGSGAATQRRYRVQFLIISGSDIVAASELSDASNAMAPAGAYTVRVTKPTTPDSATHWRVYAISGTTDTYDLYKLISGNIAVGTTTYDDSTAPASYSGDAPSALGLNIPPPSWRYMVVDSEKNRILGAGAYETSASTGETTPKYSRVWFTRPLGSSDIGDDESIPNTADFKNWIDVGENDGDVILGLGFIRGVVYVFKHEHIYALYATGNLLEPYRAERIASGIGLNVSGFGSSIIAVDDALYFPTWAGAYRLNPISGLEPIGYDIDGGTGGGPFFAHGVFDLVLRQIVWIELNNPNIYVYKPELAVRTAEGWRGGWAKWTLATFQVPRALAMFPLSGNGLNKQTLIVGGTNTLSDAKLESFSGTSGSDAGGAFTCAVTSPALVVQDGAAKFSAEAPILEAVAESDSTPTVRYSIDYGRDDRDATAPALSDGSAAHVAVKVEGLAASDAQALQVKVTWDSDQTGQIHSVIVPYREQDAR